MPVLTSTCEVSTIFSGGGPPVIGASVIVGNKQLVPSPFVNLTLEKYKTGDKVIGGVLRLTLSGTAVGSSFNGVIDGEGAGTGIKDILELGQVKGCVCVKVACESQLINGYGRIISVSANEGNQPTWVNIAPYTIEIEIYSNSALADDRPVIPDDEPEEEEEIPEDENYVLKNVSETLSWSINDDTYNAGTLCYMPEEIDSFGNRHIKVNFNLSVTGAGGSEDDSDCLCIEGEDSGPPPSGTYGLAGAEKYLRKRLKDLRTLGEKSLFDMASYSNPPILEIIPAFAIYAGGSSYLDFRNIEIDPQQNIINLSGEITYRPSGCLNPEVFTSLSVEHNVTVEDETITITGNIIGLVDNNFDEVILLNEMDFIDCAYTKKIDFAETFLSKINNPTVLKDIANCYAKTEPYPNGYITDDCEYSSGSGVCVTSTPVTPPPPETCDMRVINSQITRNIAAGEISFSFTLSNAPNCEVLGASRIDISINHDKPHDNIVEIIIPGRGSKGPLIQNLCCNSAEKYDITIDAIMNRKTCSFDVKKETINQLRNCAEKELEKLVTEGDIDISCWFKVNDIESIGNTSYKLNKSYVKPSCP